MNRLIDSLSGIDGAKAIQCQADTVTGSKWDIPTFFSSSFFLLEKSNELTRSIAYSCGYHAVVFLFLNCLTLSRAETLASLFTITSNPIGMP